MDKSKERTEDKMNINEVYLDNLKDDDMDETSEVSTKEKSKSKNDILESNIGLPCNNSNQTEPSNLLSDSEEIEIVGVHKTKDLMDKDDYKIPRKKGHDINILKQKADLQNYYKIQMIVELKQLKIFLIEFEEVDQNYQIPKSLQVWDPQIVQLNQQIL